MGEGHEVVWPPRCAPTVGAPTSISCLGSSAAAASLACRSSSSCRAFREVSNRSCNQEKGFWLLESGNKGGLAALKHPGDGQRGQPHPHPPLRLY